MPDETESTGVPPIGVEPVGAGTLGAPGRVWASFRFYAQLNDFLAPAHRGRAFPWPCAPDATLKHVIEVLGVPHTEVGLMLRNGLPVDFFQRLAAGDRVAVYPDFQAIDLGPMPVLQPALPDVTRFVADAHLGALARLLRLAGFDTVYDNHLGDGEIVALAGREQRIVLTRDLELLKRRGVSHGAYVHAQAPDVQLAEILGRFDLTGRVCPFSLCLACNAPLQAVEKEQVMARLPPRVRERQQHFSRCAACGRVFWQGNHWRHMGERLARALQAAGGSAPPGKGDLA